jgi:hypothetical protein
MAKNDPKRGLDEQPLEGGGSGSGSSFAGKAGKIAGKAAEAAAIGTGLAYTALPGIVANRNEQIQEERREAAKAKRDSRGDQDTMTPGQKQSMQDAQDAATQVKKDKAYNAAKTYPDNFSKGGTASARADGIAQRGKTRGKYL